MKNKVQARKNGSAVRTTRQTKSHQVKPSPAPEQTQTEKTMTVVFFNPIVAFEAGDPDTVIDSMELPESVFKHCEAAAKKSGVSLPEFFNQAFLEKLHRDIPARKAEKLMNLSTLETSIDAICSLVGLLYKETADRGLEALANQAVLKLKADFQALSGCLINRKSEVES